MVWRVINQPVIGIDKPFSASESPIIINVAFVPDAAFFIWKLFLTIAKAISADAFLLGNFPEVSFVALPTELSRFFLRDEIVGQPLVSMQIGCKKGCVL